MSCTVQTLAALLLCVAGCQDSKPSVEAEHTPQAGLSNTVGKKVVVKETVAKGKEATSAIGRPVGYGARGCRVTRVKGRVVGDKGLPLKRGVLLEGQLWLRLDAGAKITVKHQRGGRELSVVGPAKVLPCAGGEELVILAQGKLQTHAGVGNRPGAEALLSTPFGVMRYADARLSLEVSDERLQLKLQSGDGFWLGKETIRVVPGQTISRDIAFRKPVEVVVAECAGLAQQSQNAARKVLQVAGQGLGQRAMAHVRLRREAEVVCATALAVVLQQLSGEPRLAKLNELGRSRSLYRQVPAQKK